MSKDGYTYPELLAKFFPNNTYEPDSMCLHCRKLFNKAKGHMCHLQSSGGSEWAAIPQSEELTQKWSDLLTGRDNKNE